MNSWMQKPDRRKQNKAKQNKTDSEAQQKGETEPVILSSLMAYYAPFPTTKMSEINRRLQ